MIEDELRKKMYWICCPMCDLKKCVKDTPVCEAEQWLERKMAKEVMK